VTGRRLGTGPLLEPYELAEALRAESGLVVADARWTLGGPPGREEFEAGHIPGAQYVDLETELSRPPGPGGRHPLPDPAVLQETLRRIGVSEGKLVVAYDGATSQAASRLWWLLTDAGHGDVRVLNGGFTAWVGAGFAVETGPARSVPDGDFLVRAGQRARVSADEVATALELGRPVVDVRAADRYAGQNEIVDPVAGHIPGAISLPATDILEPDGRFVPAVAIAERFAELPDPLLYCGSGVTAAQSLLALESAGLHGTIYPGSWSEWIADPRRPVATGPEP
jgi:thiosulfate/3-mercaptopyruvate sulfurtransferase